MKHILVEKLGLSGFFLLYRVVYYFCLMLKGVYPFILFAVRAFLPPRLDFTVKKRVFKPHVFYFKLFFVKIIKNACVGFKVENKLI